MKTVNVACVLERSSSGTITLYTPTSVLEMLGQSLQLATYQDGQKFQSILKKFSTTSNAVSAHVSMLFNAAREAVLATSDEGRDAVALEHDQRIANALHCDPVELTDPEHALLKKLVEGAGDTANYAETEPAACIRGARMVLLSPILQAFVGELCQIRT